MQAGLIIEYDYAGDEAAWDAAITAFLKNIRDDAALKGRFSYIVLRTKADPNHRVHIPRWDSEATLKHVQSQPWFGAFAKAVQGFAGDSLQTRPVQAVYDSAS